MERTTENNEYVIRFYLNNREIDSNGCWNWTGAKTRDGYGQNGVSWITDTYSKLTHRTMLMAHNVEFNGEHTRHKCANRACFNPDHLALGSRADNLLDRQHEEEKNPTGKVMTVAEVMAIRDRYDTGEALKTIADDFGYTRNAVSRVGRRVGYRHLPERNGSEPIILPPRKRGVTARIEECKVREIRVRFDAGEKLSHIHRDFDHLWSRTTTVHIAKRITYWDVK